MKRLTALVPLALVGGIFLQVSPAGAESALGISGTTLSASNVVVNGTLTVGPEALAAFKVADDAAADDTDGGSVPNGFDIAEATIQANLATSRLTFEIKINDPAPEIDIAPFWNYVWQLSVDGGTSKYLTAGIAGAWTGGGVLADPNGYFRLCQNQGGFSCPTALTGALGGGTVRIVLPFNQMTIKAGSVVSPGSAIAVPSLATMSNPVATYGPAADSADPTDFFVPGGIQLGIAPAGTPETEVEYTAFTSVKTNGTWITSVPRPGETGTHTVFAKSCYGGAESGACLVTTTDVTI